jgi:hypothetical protein
VKSFSAGKSFFDAYFSLATQRRIYLNGEIRRFKESKYVMKI